MDCFTDYTARHPDTGALLYVGGSGRIDTIEDGKVSNNAGRMGEAAGGNNIRHNPNAGTGYRGTATSYQLMQLGVLKIIAHGQAETVIEAQLVEGLVQRMVAAAEVGVINYSLPPAGSDFALNPPQDTSRIVFGSDHFTIYVWRLDSVAIGNQVIISP
jgi:hypothetical protein